MSRWLRVFAAPTYQNTGSVARDHLASERTFLAWIRTGLGFMALGMASYFSNLRALERGRFRPAYLGVAVVGAAVAGLAGGAGGHALRARGEAERPPRRRLANGEEP